LSRNLGTLTSWNSLAHSRPVRGLLYLIYIYIYKVKQYIYIHTHCLYIYILHVSAYAKTIFRYANTKFYIRKIINK